MTRQLQSAALLGAVLMASGCQETVKGTFEQVRSAFAVEQQESLFDINADAIPDAIPQAEPLSPKGNPASYRQNGQIYNVLSTAAGFRENGIAQVYPTTYHGKRTASGEAYDMFAMSAAHRTLPLPSYVRVTNQRSGKSIVIRINDRGPFAKPGVIELSYAAAAKLGILRSQTGSVAIEAISSGTGQVAPRQATLNPQTSPVTRPLNRWTPPGGTVAGSAPVPAPAQPAAGELQRQPYQRIELGASRQNPPQQIASPAPSVQTPPAPTPPVEIPRSAGFDIQAGAFSSRENADRLVAKLRQAGLVPTRVVLEPSGGRTLYKVRVGPYANRRDAEQAAGALTRLGIRSPRIISP